MHSVFLAFNLLILVFIFAFYSRQTATSDNDVVLRSDEPSYALQPDHIPTSKHKAQEVPETTNEKTANKKRQNVIILTHMSSGSTFVGNVFNFHPDVFFLYEPLHDLRRNRYGDEWEILEKTRNDALRIDFSKLFRDFFTCSFKEKSTMSLVWPSWMPKEFMSWTLQTRNITKETAREACKKRNATAVKIMQTRLPGEIGIQELKRVCSSDPEVFDCSIIHLVRDPRAVLSSLIGHKFYHTTGTKKRMISSNDIATKMPLIKRDASVFCSQIEDNLNFVKEMPDWFEGRYKLIRYEDTVDDLLQTVDDMYKFVGLPMADTITKWILEGVKPIKSSRKAFSIAKESEHQINHWRFDQEPEMISLFEEYCLPMMKLAGYVPIHGSEDLQHNLSRSLRTENIPGLKSDK